MGWPLIERAQGNQTYFFMDEAAVGPEFLWNTSVLAASPWKGIPSVVCSPPQMPAGRFAVAWLKTADAELLISFSLRHGVKLVKENLELMCEACNLEVVEWYGLPVLSFTPPPPTVILPQHTPGPS
jgi:hypothetical protein